MDQLASLADAAESLLPGSSGGASSPLVLGLDIGGANIKAADTLGHTFSCPFPLWQKPDGLAAELRALLAHFPLPACFAVTMTGELADCFLDRAEGVSAIVHQCKQALGDRLLFYSVEGMFVAAEDAVEFPDQLAASNWHALASLVAPCCDQTGLLIDIGSTTCDIIPLKAGHAATHSRTDFDRLMTGELVYLGIGRTPVCSIVDAMPLYGQFVPVMNEVFANMDDCAILLNHVAPEPDDCSTCDGRPRTVAFAANRLARMVGLDHRTVTLDDAVGMAQYVVSQWQARLRVAIEILSPADSVWVLSGHGTKLLEIPYDKPCIDLSVILGEQLSRAAPAYAVARLAKAKLVEK